MTQTFCHTFFISQVWIANAGSARARQKSHYSIKESQTNRPCCIHGETDFLPLVPRGTTTASEPFWAHPIIQHKWADCFLKCFNDHWSTIIMRVKYVLVACFYETRIELMHEKCFFTDFWSRVQKRQIGIPLLAELDGLALVGVLHGEDPDAAEVRVGGEARSAIL